LVRKKNGKNSQRILVRGKKNLSPEIGYHEIERKKQQQL